MIYPGAQQLTTATVRNRSGQLTAPATVVFTVRSPRGVEMTYGGPIDALPTAEVAQSSPGVYELTWTPTEGGEWRIRCRTTGAVKQSVEAVVKVEHTGFRN